MRRPEGCLSDYALDRELAGEAKSSHIETCERCSARRAVLAEEKSVFAKTAPALRPRARVFPWPRIVGGLAVAAALLLFLAYRPPADDGTRTKGGGEKLGFYVSHDGAVRLGGMDERVNPGDGLRFVVTTPAPRYVAVLSLDGLHHASVYFDSHAPIASGPLPESTTLDDALGDETIYGVFCPNAFDAQALRRELAERPLTTPEGCSIDTLHFRKDAAAPP